MKKIFTLLAALLVGGTASMAKTFDQVFPADFSQGIPEGWAFFNDATTEQVEGGIKVTCSQTAPNYRADLKYNMKSENADNYYTLNASEYKIIAIQFIGKRPESGSLKMSNIGILNSENKTSWIKNAEGYSLKESAWTDIQDINGNHTYYWTIGGDNWTDEKTITKIEIVIADIKNEADKSYTVAWINWFKGEDDLKAHLDLDAVVDQTGKGYENLDAAWAAATDGDVLTVKTDQTASDRLQYGSSRSLTIQGATPDVKISRGNAGKLLLLASKGGNETLTLKNLTLDGLDKDATCSFIEASNGSTVNLENVKIQNAKSSHIQGLVTAKSGGKLVVKNLNVSNCGVNENTGHLFFGQNTSCEISGNNAMSISVENSPFAVSEGETLDNTEPIVIYKYNNGQFADGDAIVNNCTDASKFKLGNTNLVLKEENGNLVAREDENTGIAGIEADENAPVEYFNLNGVQVKADNMTPGVYVRRQGKNVTKVMVK
jgi:hypothetical protein